MNLSIEFLCALSLPAVEKDGTGIAPIETAGCHPFENIAAEITQEVFVEHGSSRCRRAAFSIARPRACCNLALN
jgi:hypothetical protein